MEPSLIHSILIHLYRNDAINEQQINVTAFLKTLRDKNDDRVNNFNRIVMALDRIKQTGYASYNCSPSNNILNQTIDGVPCTLDNTDVNMQISFEGWSFIKNFIRENEQHGSALKTNESVKTLNDQLPNIYKKQTRLTIATIVVAIVSFIAVAVSAYYSSQSVTSAQFKTTNTLLERNLKILDSIRLHQRDIDQSLQRAVNDSLYSRKKNSSHSEKSK